MESALLVSVEPPDSKLVLYSVHSCPNHVIHEADSELGQGNE